MTPRDTVPTGGLRCEDEAYGDALARFLAGSDEKARTHAYLDDVVRRMPVRRVLLDVGAGDGTTACHLSRFFERTVCIEPSEHMRRVLERACPHALVLADPVLRAQPGVSADLALLSHVLYYVPRAQWAPTVLRVLDWVEPGGTLLIVLQNPDDACMRMVRHFTGNRFDLRELADELTTTGNVPARALALESVPARYTGTDLDEVVAVAAFHLNVPSPGPGGEPVSREAVADYVRRHFADRAGGFTMSHAQDVLRIHRPRP
ncbi:methyltransferase domain-containing protein [Streptomyces sp. NPDC052701]|uniref:class I SAM-dependent methyltransferase n=1 Tax=Streptomyces sp. NPDC052701 TaxID=3155533 RepID=UPI00343F962F